MNKLRKRLLDSIDNYEKFDRFIDNAIDLFGVPESVYQNLRQIPRGKPVYGKKKYLMKKDIVNSIFDAAMNTTNFIQIMTRIVDYL